jgi:hypothetical protein
MAKYQHSDLILFLKHEDLTILSKNIKKIGERLIIIEKLILLRICYLFTCDDSCFCCRLTWVVRFANFTDPFHE